MPFDGSHDFVPLLQIISCSIQPVTEDVFGQLKGGKLELRCAMFEMPSLRPFKSDYQSFSERSTFDPWALAYDEYEMNSIDEQTWFLPIAHSPTVSVKEGLTLCGVLVQQAPADGPPTFRRVGFAIVSEDGDIANSGWYCATWAQRPWPDSLYKTVILI